MYCPKDFIEADPAVIRKLMQDYPFVTIVTQTSDGPVANHLRVIRSENDIRGVVRDLKTQSDDMSRAMRELMVLHYPSIEE